MDNPMLVSVTGEIAAGKIRLADAHNHLWIAAVADAAPDSPVLTDFDLLLRELNEFAAAANGLAAQFDCQPGGFGRNAVKLRELSGQSGVVIVSSTGYHLKKYAPSHWLWTASAGRAADHFIHELTVGVEEAQHDAPIRAGFIKIAHGAVPDYLAFMDHRNKIGNFSGGCHIMRDRQRRRAKSLN